MKCQILFSGKTKKNIINLSSAENAQRVVKVKGIGCTFIGGNSVNTLINFEFSQKKKKKNVHSIS